MKSEYFRKVIRFSNDNISLMRQKAETFYNEVGVRTGAELINPVQIIRLFLKKMNCYVIEMPLKDQQMEAVCYKGNYAGYVVLNSALPVGSVHFSLCHMLGHLLDWRDTQGLHTDISIRKQCYEDAKELEADLFARMLLMPEQSFTNMFRKLQQENTDIVTELIMLMCYYKVPFFSVLIRCYELCLLEDGELLCELLHTEEEKISSVVSDYWLDGMPLEVTHRDEYAAFRRYAAYMGSIYEKQLEISRRTITKALANMDEVYHRIKEEI